MSRLDQLRANLESSREDGDEGEASSAPDEAVEVPESAAEPTPADGAALGKPMETVSPESPVPKRVKDPATGQFTKQQVAPTPSKQADTEKQKGPTKPQKDGQTPPRDGAQAPALRPPANWKPQAKEHWAKLPREVQEDALRAHTEAQKALQESATARQFGTQFQQTMAPFAPMIAADRTSPLEAVRNVFQTVAGLRMGSQAQKDAIAASIIRDYGCSVDGINAHLEGHAPRAPQQAPQQQPQQFRDPRLDDFLAQRQAHVASEGQKTVNEFVQANEFMDNPNFSSLVADLMDNSHASGRPLEMSEAYEVAKSLDPDVKSILSQRKAAESANVQRASMQRSRAAASSVKSQPAGIVSNGSSGGPMSRRDMLTAAAARARGDE